MGKVKKEKNSKNLQEKISEAEVNRKHKNLEKNKSSVEDGTRKYGYISANSVISMAESAGFSGIQEEVAKNLAEDVTYRLRYIIQQCKKYMIHSKRKKLRSADINEVLRMCDTPAIYGYTADKPLHNFIYIKEADVFILEDDVVDLPSFALTDALVLRKPPYLATGMWLKVEEKSKIKAEIKTKHSDVKINNSNIQCSENSKVSTKNLLHCENLRLGNENEENETKIPTNLIKYYGITCNTLLGHSDLKIIFQDLSNNSRIVPIVPYLLNFITIALNKLSSERQLQRLLQTVEALSRNDRIDFTPYSATARVINAMLLVVASDKKPARICHDFHLKAHAARVLSSVLRQWCFRDEQRQMVVRKMANILGDAKASPRVHYGALALLAALGPEALSAGLWRTLARYLDYLDRLGTASDRIKTGNDRARLEEIILTASASLYRCSAKEDLASEADGHLSSYFGDAMCSLRLNAVPALTPFERMCAEGAKAETKWPKVFRCIDCSRRPHAKKLSVENVFVVPKSRKRKNTKIIFEFAGAITVPEKNLKRRKFYSQYLQFPKKPNETERRVVVAKKWPRVARAKNSSHFYCLFSVL